jgi:hypothetical protein
MWVIRSVLQRLLALFAMVRHTLSLAAPSWKRLTPWLQQSLSAQKWTLFAETCSEEVA